MVTLPGARPGAGEMSQDADRGILRARRDAVSAAERAGVSVRSETDTAVLERACELFERLWQESPDDRAMTPLVLRALTHAGNYLGVAWDADQLVGACVGFIGLDPRMEMHSHIAGVATVARGRSVGFALKLHQRAWSLERGLDVISWSFDPLIRRNAYFNIGKLAAGVRAYHANFYGPMTDGINLGDDSDRLIAEWRLRDGDVSAACAGRPAGPDLGERTHPGVVSALALGEDGRPVPGTTEGTVILVAVPPDIEAIRVADPGLAREWRAALRDVLGGLLADGGQVVGFDRTGHYVVRRSGT